MNQPKKTGGIVPVVTIDGPSASGKGTVARILADHQGWHYLDSGALYRLLALAVQQRQWSSEHDMPKIVKLAHQLNINFKFCQNSVEIFLDNQCVGDKIYTENIGATASKLSALPQIRAALFDRQRCFRQAPGLVTDGRDMGTVIFPDATVKFFLIADAKERAQRRYRQLQQQGINVKLAELESELLQRDQRDKQRAISPLVAAEDAIEIDSSRLSIDQVVSMLIARVEQQLRSVLNHSTAD